MNKLASCLLLAMASVILCNTAILAQDQTQETVTETSQEINKHQISVFNGCTGFLEASYSIGGSYEYRFSKNFGVGALGRYIEASDESFLGPAVFAHTARGARYILAPLIVFEKDDMLSQYGSPNKTSYGLMIGAEREYQLGNFLIGPSFSVNIIDIWFVSVGFSVAYSF